MKGPSSPPLEEGLRLWSIPQIDATLRENKQHAWKSFLRVMAAVPTVGERTLIVELIQSWANAPYHKAHWGRTRWEWKRRALRELREYQRTHGLPAWEPGKLDPRTLARWRRFNEATEQGKRPELFDLTSVCGIGEVDLGPEMGAVFLPPSYKHLDNVRWEKPPTLAADMLAVIAGLTPCGCGRPSFEETSRHWWTDRNSIALILMELLKQFSGSYHYRDLADILSVFTPQGVSHLDLKNLTDRYAFKIKPEVARLFPHPKVRRRPRKKE
jgi:hypothetical protein